MTTPNKPSDPTPSENPWDDLDIVPVAPPKDSYQAKYLYQNGPQERWGLFGLFANPIVGTLALVGLVLMVAMTLYGNHQENLRQEAQARKAVANMASFKKALAASGMTAACLDAPKGSVPYQYFGECQAVAKAHAAAKEARK